VRSKPRTPWSLPALALALVLPLALALVPPRPAQVAAQSAGDTPAPAPPIPVIVQPPAPQRPPRPPIAELVPPGLGLSSASALVVDEAGRALYAKGTRDQRPIASITKLMTAMVVLDSAVPLDQPLTILEEDRDQLRHSRSRLRIDRAATLQRREVLAVALMSSDNRAAAALGRTTFPGGKPIFVAAMNRKAEALGMLDSRFADPTGLDGNNTSTAEDLVMMARAAAAYPLIRELTTSASMEVHPYGDAGTLQYRNTNPLVRSPDWHLELSKTGFVNEAGHCLVMRAVIGGRLLSIVLLDSPGKRSPVGDSNRLRKWLETHPHGLSG
jgi:D-alanyl-D-alanine endopeptidase (penicillin-binding protein 7)